ncbi:ABC transporter substrate-binding protein [bacterium AH-315-B06]|nr:ABC transporter substrate-binding protein [bacterium AH-315-B06]
MAEFFLGRFLVFNGLRLQDVEIVNLVPSKLVDAISAGNIDASITWEPNIYKIRNHLSNNAVTLGGKDIGDYYFLLLAKAQWIKTHTVAVERLLQALIRANQFTLKNSVKAQGILQDRFKLDLDFLQYFWGKVNNSVNLPQALLTVMEDEARWAIENNLVDGTHIPNYLDFLYLDGLKTVRPEAITVIY